MPKLFSQLRIYGYINLKNALVAQILSGLDWIPACAGMTAAGFETGASSP
jgi:hypothetical protein